MDCESAGIIECTVGVAAGWASGGRTRCAEVSGLCALDDRHCELRVFARNTILPTYQRMIARFEHKALVVL